MQIDTHSHHTVSHPGRDRTVMFFVRDHSWWPGVILSGQGSFSTGVNRNGSPGDQTASEGQWTLSELARDCGTACAQDGSSAYCHH